MSDPLRQTVPPMTADNGAQEAALDTAATSDDILFPTFDDDALSELAGFGHRRPIASGDVLFRPGDDLPRRSNLNARMSRYLIDRIEVDPRIEILTDTEVRALGGGAHLEHVTLEHTPTRQQRTVSCSGLFCFIGAEAATAWLGDALALDPAGFVLTDRSILTSALGDPLFSTRDPLPFETCAPGVFAAGDDDTALRNASRLRWAKDRAPSAPCTNTSPRMPETALHPVVPGVRHGDRPTSRNRRPSDRRGTNMSPDEQSSLVDLLQAEKAGWEELEGLVEALSPEQAEISGYLPGWSVKDFLAHLAGWLAEAGQALEQIGSGTFTDDVDVDSRVDSRNRAFVDANRDQPLSVVLFEVKAARRRLLHHLHGLTEIPPPAVGPLRKAGPQHYAQHLPRLREWVAELRSEHPPSE